MPPVQCSTGLCQLGGGTAASGTPAVRRGGWSCLRDAVAAPRSSTADEIGLTVVTVPARQFEPCTEPWSHGTFAAQVVAWSLWSTQPGSAKMDNALSILRGRGEALTG
jgi:hypothetical protein